MLDAKNLLANIDSNGIISKMLGGMVTKNFVAGLLTGSVATSLLGGGKDTVETVAKVDGHMDAAESQIIIGQLESVGVGAEEKALLMQEMANTQNVNSIAAAAATPEESAQIYLAALLVCDSQCVREQEYLASLASALKMEPAFTASLHNELLSMSTQKAA